MHKDRYIGRQPRPYRSLLAMAVAFSLAVGCSIKSPSAPSWEVVYNLPLLNQWFDITDFLEDEDFAPVGADSVYTIEFEESIEQIEVGSDITLEGFDQSVSESIGMFTVPAAQPQSTLISLQDLGGPADSGGIAIPIPALSFPGVRGNLPVFDAFTQVVIDTGTVTVSVTNNTKVDFDTLSVRLLDEGAGDALVVEVNVTGAGTLFDGDNRVVAAPLDGITVGSDLDVEVRGHSLAGNAIVDGSERIDIVVTVGELRVRSATAEVGELDFDFPPKNITLPGDTKVTSATLASGTLTLTLDNQLPVPLDLAVELPNLTDGAGSPVRLNPIANPGMQSSVAHPLNDHTLAPGDVGGDKVISVVVNVHSDGSGVGQVTLASTDSVAVQVTITELVVQAVTGVLDSTTVALPDSSFGLEIESGNLLDELRKVDLTAVDFEITVRHNIDFPAYLELDLVGEGGVPDPVELNIAFDLQPSGYTPTGPGDPTSVTDVLSLDETNSTVLDFLNAFPTTISYSGSVTVGNGIYSGSVSSYSWDEADVRFSTPLLSDITAPISIGLDKKYSEEGVTELGEGIEIQEATLTYSLASTMGLPLIVQFAAASDSADVYTNPQVELVMVLRASAAAAQDTVVTLTSDQWDLLSQPIFTGLRITIPPTGGTPFRVAKSDSLLVRAFVTVQALIKPGDDEGGGGGR